MLRVTIELVPNGDEERTRELTKMQIANVGGSSSIGKYNVEIFDKPPVDYRVLYDGHVDHPRCVRGWRRAAKRTR